MPDLNYLSTQNRPEFLILGVQKSATTTLFDVLNNLDGFSGSSHKELHFFDNDHNYQKGMAHYSGFFGADKTSLRFEATPSYIYSCEAPGRIFKSFGSMKFIVMLRDPVKRCFSAWNMFRVFNSNQLVAQNIYETFIKDMNVGAKERLRELLFSANYPTFEQCVNDDLLRRRESDVVEEPSFVRRGFYYEQIMRYLEFFNLQDFLFLEQDDFARNAIVNIARVCEFLGVESSFDSTQIEKTSNKGDYDGVVLDAHADVFLKLYDLYREPNKKLFALIGKEYPWNASWMSL
ncbi:sulfotransferase domain-containing protein [Pseudomonas sp. NPDC087342]|uniref:sulfotransferase domain-containing protein n=1 Tax=Pseudomonas sp. NPDC087342 TaxID=3364437 RepID=UPI0038293DFC